MTITRYLKSLNRPSARALPILTALAFAVAASLASGGAAARETDPFFGVVSQRVLDSSEFNLMAWGRIGSYRVPVNWGSIEPEADGNMNWSALDDAVEATASRGIDFLPTIYGSPRVLNDNWRTLPIRNRFQIRKYRRFLLAMVDRYGSGGSFWLDHPEVDYRPVTRWQIWNEPNIRNFSKPVSPKRYAKLLKISSNALTSVDRSARIVLGGLYGKPPRGTGIKASRFLASMYRYHGTKQNFDVVAVHPYAVSIGKSLRRTTSVRRIMIRKGDTRKPVVITELGWGADSTTGFGLGSASAQAEMLRRAYRTFLAHRNILNLRGIYWFSWSDMPTELKVCEFCAATGFFDESGDPKDSWYEFLNFTHGI
jgi:hypothetical protein